MILGSLDFLIYQPAQVIMRDKKDGLKKVFSIPSLFSHLLSKIVPALFTNTSIFFILLRFIKTFLIWVNSDNHIERSQDLSF